MRRKDGHVQITCERSERVILSGRAPSSAVTLSASVSQGPRLGRRLRAGEHLGQHSTASGTFIKGQQVHSPCPRRWSFLQLIYLSACKACPSIFLPSPFFNI